MIKQLLSLFVGCSITAGAGAALISPEQALSRLDDSGIAKKSAINMAGLKHAYTTVDAAGMATSYIFSNANSVGYVILSSDDRAVPVLGYSDTNNIDVNNLPPSLVWWLGEQSARLKNVSEKAKDGNVKPYAPADMTPIDALMTTTWNQDAPYNKETPVINNVQTPTGCVATSFAQVMNYFKYPERGQGSIRYATNGRYLSMNFNKKFDWDNMLDSYSDGYTTEQADAVAFLMKACGYSVEMNYGIYASGAVSFKLAKAAVDYFKYDKGLYYTEREFFSYDEWAHLIYNNIKNVGPVIYDGSSIDGGHSFVCDGYDGNGYFHFNWGWGGMSDGFYVLDSLNPESQGIGGAEGGFNYSQGALLGMCPSKGDSSQYPLANLNIYGNARPQMSGNDLIFTAYGSSYQGWGNASFRDITVGVGAIITKVSDGSVVAEVDGGMKSSSGNLSNQLTLSPGSYMPTANSNPCITLPALPDGEYKVTIAAKDMSVEDAPLQPIMKNWGCVNYCFLTVAGGKASVSTASPLSLNIEKCEFDSPLYLGRNAKLNLTFKNTTDEQLTLCYSPVLYKNGRIQYRGDYTLVTVDAGQLLEKDTFVKFVAADDATFTGPGEYTLKVLNCSTGEFIGSFSDYNMTSVSNNLVVDVIDFSIKDAELKSVVSGSREFSDVYEVSSSSDITAHLNFDVTQGYFDMTYRLMGAMYNPETNKFENLSEDLYSDQPLIGQGDSLDTDIDINLSNYPGNRVYRVAGTYKVSGSNKSLGIIYLTFKDTGIDAVISDTESAEYYNLQGLRVENPQKGQLLIKKSGSKIEKVIF